MQMGQFRESLIYCIFTKLLAIGMRPIETIDTVATLSPASSISDTVNFRRTELAAKLGCGNGWPHFEARREPKIDVAGARTQADPSCSVTYVGW